MGVDYSTTLGYGYHGSNDYDKLPAVLKELADGTWLGEECVTPWLDEQGFDLIEFDTIGNWMDGSTFWFFYLKDTYIHYGIYDQDGVHTFETPDLSVKEYVQLGKLRELLDFPNAATWVVSFNVS